MTLALCYRVIVKRNFQGSMEFLRRRIE